MPPTDKRTNIRWLDFSRSGIPGVDRESDPVAMDAGSSPDVYGVNLTTEGRLSKGTIVTGTTRIDKTYTVNSNVYNWMYDRLFRASTNELIYGAPHYTSEYYKQGVGKLVFDDDAENIVEFIQFGRDSILVCKATCSYIVSGLNDTRGESFWSVSEPIQEAFLTDAAHITELDGVAYISNANGLWAVTDRGEVKEITRRVRNDLTNFTNVDLKADYQSKRIIADDGTSKFVYSVERDRLYTYNPTGFRYTSPDLHADDYAPVEVTRIHFIVQNASSPIDDQSFTIQMKQEDGDWSDEERIDVNDQRDQYSTVTVEVEKHLGGRQSRRTKFRITDMTDDLRIRAVYFDAANAAFQNYSE